MLSLTMSLVSCDACMVPTASHDQMSYHTLFQLSSCNEESDVIDDAVRLYMTAVLALMTEFD